MRFKVLFIIKGMLMEIKAGTSRIVLLIPTLKIAVKFANPYIWQAVKTTYGFFAQIPTKAPQDWARWFKIHWTYNPKRQILSIPQMLFQGVFENWSEFWFCQQARNPMAQPTYFSFFGLINIQAISKPCMVNEREFRQYMEHFLGSKEFYSDSHHFSRLKNFGLRHGRLIMVDYGTRQTQDVLRKHGTRMSQEFDLAKCVKTNH
jgi:hypothetical protein